MANSKPIVRSGTDGRPVELPAGDGIEAGLLALYDFPNSEYGQISLSEATYTFFDGGGGLADVVAQGFYGEFVYGGRVASAVATPSQITGNQNNYAPAAAGIYRLSTDATRTVTGLSIGQVSGQQIEIVNVGSFSLVLSNQSASSAAANRFLCGTGADITLAANERARGFYDSTSTRWRIAKV